MDSNPHCSARPPAPWTHFRPPGQPRRADRGQTRAHAWMPSASSNEAPFGAELDWRSPELVGGLRRGRASARSPSQHGRPHHHPPGDSDRITSPADTLRERRNLPSDPRPARARSPPSGVLDPLTRAASPAPDSAPSRSSWPPAIGPATSSSAALPRAAAPTSSEPPSPADATYLQAPSHLRSAPSPSGSATPVQAHPQPRRQAAPSHPSRAPGPRPRVTLLARQTPPHGHPEQSHSRKAEPRLLRPLPLTRVTPHPLRHPLLPP